MRNWAFMGLSLVVILTCSSASSATPDALGQFDLATLAGVCSAVSTQQKKAGNQEEYSYVYEKKIFDAARIDFTKDNGATARMKIQTLWKLHPSDLSCDANNFNVRDGALLKYAVATRTFNLIDVALKTWKIDPNIIDPSDGKTLLDYIEDSMPRWSGSTVGLKLQIYREIVIENGGLHAQDVPSIQVTAQRLAFVQDVRCHLAHGYWQHQVGLEAICRKEPAVCR